MLRHYIFHICLQTICRTHADGFNRLSLERATLFEKQHNLCYFSGLFSLLSDREKLRKMHDKWKTMWSIQDKILGQPFDSQIFRQFYKKKKKLVQDANNIVGSLDPDLMIGSIFRRRLCVPFLFENFFLDLSQFMILSSIKLIICHTFN